MVRSQCADAWLAGPQAGRPRNPTCRKLPNAWVACGPAGLAAAQRPGVSPAAASVADSGPARRRSATGEPAAADLFIARVFQSGPDLVCWAARQGRRRFGCAAGLQHGVLPFALPQSCQEATDKAFLIATSIPLLVSCVISLNLQSTASSCPRPDLRTVRRTLPLRSRHSRCVPSSRSHTASPSAAVCASRGALYPTAPRVPRTRTQVAGGLGLYTLRPPPKELLDSGRVFEDSATGTRFEAPEGVTPERDKNVRRKLCGGS